MLTVHGTCIELSGVGVLLRGAPGSGKSDLALRLIDGGARLVADDRVTLAVRGQDLIASAPSAIAGRMEVRGIGIVAVAVAAAPVPALGLVVDLVAPETVDRLPEQAECEYLGIAIPVVSLAPFESSAAAKVRLAVRCTRRDSGGGTWSTRSDATDP